MGLKRTDEFRADAVRIALASRLTRKQVADDPLPGRVFSKEMPREGGCWHVDTEQMDHVASTARQCMFTCMRGGDTGVVSKEDLSLAQENERLRRENPLLKEEREILKRATQFFAGQKP